MRYLVLFAVALITGWLYYRKSVPSLSKGERTLLTSLRTLSFFLILLYLFNPVLYYIQKVRQRSEVIILSDTSDSMMGIENGGQKSAFFNELKLKVGNIYSDAGYEVTNYHFANGLVSKGNSADLSKAINQLTKKDRTHIAKEINQLTKGDKTDLTKAINQLTKEDKLENVTEIVLVSDGWFHDTSFDAIQLSGKPINPIIPEFKETLIDTRITKVDFNENAFKNETTPYLIHCQSSEFSGDATINMYLEDKLLQSKDVSFKADNYNTTEFTNRFSEIGLKRIKFELVAKELEEQALNNNSTILVTNVLAEKETILIITDALNWETKYFVDALKNNARLQPDVLIAKNRLLYSGRDLIKEDLKSINYSLLVLINNGSLAFNPQNNNAIIDNLSKNKGVLLIGMPIRSLSAVAPLGYSNISRKFTATLNFKSDMNDYRSFEFINADIENIPPVDYKYYKPLLNAEVLANFSNDELSPSIAIKKSGSGRFLHLGMLNLWKWQLWGNGNNYRKFIVSLCNWLSNKAEDRVAFFSSRNGYLHGEEITLTLKAFDEKMDLIPDLQPSLKVRNSKSKNVVSDYMELSSGSYSISLNELPPDKYTATVTDKQNNIESTLSFIVSEKGLEDTNLGLNRENLSYIASLTTGTVLTNQTIKSFKPDRAEEKNFNRNVEIPLYRKHLLLILFLIVFALELLIRRRKGLI